MHPTCDLCEQPATIHETTVEDGAAVTRHLCQEHGATAMPDVGLGPQAAQAAEELNRRLSAAEKEHFALLYRLTHRST
jgi:protein-arginine kinase activator protein McsA